MRADGVQGYRRDHHDHKVTHPMSKHSDGSTLIPNTKRLDLGAVAPTDWQYAKGEAVQEEEHESHGNSVDP